MVLPVRVPRPGRRAPAASTKLSVSAQGSQATAADLAIVDDPFRSREDAESEGQRGKVWDWWQSDLLPRLKPGGKIVLILTRWHQDDVAGRLLESEPDRWRVVKLPA